MSEVCLSELIDYTWLLLPHCSAGSHWQDKGLYAMYLGQSQNFNAECVVSNWRQTISDFTVPLSLCSSVLRQSLSFLQRNWPRCLRSLFRYWVKQAKSKHFPVCLAFVEYDGKRGGSVDGGIIGGGRSRSLSFGKLKWIVLTSRHRSRKSRPLL